MKFDYKNIHGLLIDIAGTLEFKQKPIEGAPDTYRKLKAAGYKLKLLTNTDSKDPRTYIELLQDFGFPVTLEDIYTPIIALVDFIKTHPNSSFYILSTQQVFQFLKDMIIENENKILHISQRKEISLDFQPDYTVICDFSDNWQVLHLDDAFRYISKGSKLIGSQGNRYYLDKKGNPRLDTGSFVEMIRSATSGTLLTLGKPNASYFLKAAESLQLQSHQVIVIGDDIESDIFGGQQAQMTTILVETGKGQRKASSHLANIKPSLQIPSFSSLETILL